MNCADSNGRTMTTKPSLFSAKSGINTSAHRRQKLANLVCTLIPLLRKILEKYKKKFPPSEDDWIFRGERYLRPLDLDNLSRRDLPEHVHGQWFGWHTFRRGLGTRLNEAEVDDTEIQSILRHADVSTTQAYDILPNRKRAEAGLRKLNKTMRTKYGIKHRGP